QRTLGRRRRGHRRGGRNAAPDRARAYADRVRRRPRLLSADPAEGDGTGGRAARRGPQPRWARCPQRIHRQRRTRSLARAARAGPATDRSDLLQRPDGRRRAAGGGSSRHPRARRAVGCRLRRDRRDALDESGTDDCRAADRGDRGDRRERAQEPDRGAAQAAAGLLVPPPARSTRLDSTTPVTELTTERCVACRRDAPTVTPGEIAELQPQVPDWELLDVDGVKRLRRSFAFDGFAPALAFTNAVGALAEE